MSLQVDSAVGDVEELLDILKGNTVEKAAYLSMLKQRKILLNDEINGSIIESVVVPLMEFEKDASNEPVYFYINSNGGSAFDSFFITNIIESYKKPLVIVNMGYALSAGFLLFIAGKNNPNVKRVCYNRSIGLLHAGSMAVDGNTDKVRDLVNFNDRLDEMTKNFVLNNSNLSAEDYEKHWREDWYFTAEDMEKYGMVDEILA